MNIVIRGRGKGKTEYLIAEAARVGTRIVTHTGQDAQRLEREFKRRGIKAPTPIGFRSLLNNPMQSKGLSLSFDNLDLSIGGLLHDLSQNLVSATLSNPVVDSCEEAAQQMDAKMYAELMAYRELGTVEEISERLMGL